jgi:hypothetical protein
MIVGVRAAWMLTVVAACGRLSFDPLGDSGASDGASNDSMPPCNVGPWGSPQRIANLATAANDWGPALSDDALTLVWDSGIAGSDDLYVAVRANTASPFGNGTSLGFNSPTKQEYSPTWLGSSLYYSVIDPAAMTLTTMVTAYRGNGTFDPPTVVPEALPVGDALTFSENGLEGFYTTNPVAQKYYLRHMTRPALGADWVGDTLVDSFTPVGTVAGWPTFDDRRQSLYFERTVGAGAAEIVETTRSDATSAFGSATHVDTGGSDDSDPEISRDGLTMVFASARAGGAGMNDLYVMTRACQ